MDLTFTPNIRELLAKYNTKPLKGLGQNFLIHSLTIKKIVEAAQINDNDTVLEIGPGIGTLTQALAQKAKKVIAIEKDGIMVEILKETLKNYPNVEVIQGDALSPVIARHPQMAWQSSAPYKVVANLPYYITSPIIRLFLEMPNPPECLVLMVQKEVAQRICATPPNMSILAASVQFYAEAKIITQVTKEKFWPSPNIDSAVIKIIPHSSSSLRDATAARQSSVSPDKFFQVVKAGFSHPRKQLANNFSVSFKKNREEIAQWLQKNNLKPEQRAETLTIQDWINLTNSVNP